MSTPDPLVPHFVDLTDYPDMPLEARRLRDSGIATDEDAEVFRGAVLLWAAAWHQRPAASVPDSDDWLASVCGYKSRAGIDPRWTDIRPGVLRGFVLCSDGRLYHDVLASKAVAAWESKVHHRYRLMYDRIRKRNEIRVKSGEKPIVIPNVEAFIASGFKDPEPPRNSFVKRREEKRSKEEAPTSSSLPARTRASHTRARARVEGDPPKAKGSKRCPADFTASPALREWASLTTPGVDVDRELAAMRDHEFARPRSDWEATARNWLREAFKRGGGRTAGQAPAARSAAERRATTASNLTRNRRASHDDDPRPEPPDDIVDVAARIVEDGGT